MVQCFIDFKMNSLDFGYHSKTFGNRFASLERLELHALKTRNSKLVDT